MFPSARILLVDNETEPLVIISVAVTYWLAFERVNDDPILADESIKLTPLL